MGYVIYLDLLGLEVAMEFLTDWLLLWAAGEVVQVRATPWRLAMGAAVGSGYSLLWTLLRLGLFPSLWVLRHPLVILILPAIMVGVAYGLKARTHMPRLVAAVYVAAILALGTGITASGLMVLPWWVQRLLPAGVVLFLAEVGWGILKRRLWQGALVLPLEIEFGGDQLRVEALVDTGNQISDPLTGSPVIILEWEVIRPHLPQQVLDVMEKVQAGDLGALGDLVTDPFWASRLRVLPFRSIGKEQGMLLGFRPDAVRIGLSGELRPVPKAVIGLYRQALSTSGSYRALLHPDALPDLGRSLRLREEVGL